VIGDLATSAGEGHVPAEGEVEWRREGHYPNNKVVIKSIVVCNRWVNTVQTTLKRLKEHNHAESSHTR
jgi:hypothetical protein